MYYVGAGDNTSGTGTKGPDPLLNAACLRKCANFVLPRIIYNAGRKVVCIDSGMCQAAFFTWMHSQMADGVVFTALVLSNASIKVSVASGVR